MTNERADLEALKKRADKLGYQIEPSLNKPGYCLWEVLPRVGRYLILGRDGGVTLDVIAQRLDEVEAGKKAR
jgi:predicted CoA-binding protein